MTEHGEESIILLQSTVPNPPGLVSRGRGLVSRGLVSRDRGLDSRGVDNKARITEPTAVYSRHNLIIQYMYTHTHTHTHIPTVAQVKDWKLIIN